MTLDSQAFPPDTLPPSALLQWYLEAGVDEAIGEEPVDRFALSQAVLTAKALAPRPAAAPAPVAATAAVVPMSIAPNESAAALATAAQTLDELRAALLAFDGCSLKATATTTVFGDGNPAASLMIIGEAPGREEDEQGLPFVGESGRLLARMLASIGCTDRTSYYITNVVPWRPPGNRTPSDAEVALCLPFIARHIALVQPKALLFLGGLPTKALLGRNEGITRLRGQWFEYQAAGMAHPIPAIATFHPAYLLRQPAQKRLTWRDLLTVQERLAAVQDDANGVPN